MLVQAQDLIYNVTGQKVRYFAPQGRPDSVTSVKVWDQRADDDSTEESALGAPSVTTSPDTTISSASGAGQSNPRLLNVNSTTGFDPGSPDQYLITGSQGEKEFFQCLEVGTGLVIAAAPLQHAYVSTNTVETTGIEATIDATWVAEKANISGTIVGPGPRWRVRWEYVIGSTTYVADSYYDLLRYPGEVVEITPLDVENHQAGWLQQLPEDHQADQGRRLIRNGRRMVEVHLQIAERNDALARDTDTINHLILEATLERTAWARFAQTGKPELERLWERQNETYRGELDQLVRAGSVTPFAEDQGGHAARTPPTKIWRR